MMLLTIHEASDGARGQCGLAWEFENGLIFDLYTSNRLRFSLYMTDQIFQSCSTPNSQDLDG